MAPHEIESMVTMVAGLNQASKTERKIKETLDIRINVVSFLSDACVFMNPAYISFEIEDDVIRTSAAKVDMDADSISIKIMMDKDSGITFDRNSGIKAS